MFFVMENGGLYSEFVTLEAAVDMAEMVFGYVDPQGEATVSVENAEGECVAVFTNRKIIGSFTKQAWGGRKGDDAIYVGTEEFDATDHVLLLDHAELVALVDGGERTDEVGLAHFDWRGPSETAVCESICDYFGVQELEQISPEALSFARARRSPKPAVEQTLTLSIKVDVSMIGDATLKDFVENLDYSVISNTPGVRVRMTELVDA